MRQGHAIKQVSAFTPIGQVFVHIGHKAFVVVAFQQMYQLMHQNVLKALRWLFCQFEVQPNAFRLGVAAAPFGFHLFDAPARRFNTDLILPVGEQLGDAGFDFCPVKLD